MTAVAPPPAALPTAASSSVVPAVEVSKPANDDKPADKPVSAKKESKEDNKETPKSSDEKDGKSTNPHSPTNPPETSTTDERPRATSGARSLFDLEPNPFEQSFSKGSQSDRTTPPRGGDATSVKHNALPPLSSLTSPAAADPSQFPWLAGHSLRSGPLSPAMLAGPAQGSQQPQNNNAAAPPAGAAANTAAWGGGDASNNEGNSADQENFEPGNFRTGFTPGTGTGFTPGYNALLNSNFGGALPMPSPNTAAFLNSITNVTENGDQSNANQQPAQGGSVMDRPPPSAIPPHLQPQNHGPVAPPLNPGNGVPDPNALNALGSVANNLNRGGPPGGPMPPQQPYYPPGMHPGGPGLAPGMPQVDYAQQNANAASQAANGLFLLSQAHQELSKREREEAQSSPVGKRGAGVPPANKNQAAGAKRKDAAPKGGAAKRSKKKDGSVSSSEEEKETKKPNRPETEEEKRRNFLERNRQAALKCRQRKKAWLNELQTKVETLSVENERLNHTVRSLEDELQRLSAILMQHRECGLAIPPAPMAPAYGRPLR